MIALNLGYKKNKLSKTTMHSMHPEICLISEKGVGIDPRSVSCMIFKEKCFSCYIFLSDQVSFTCWDIGQYVNCNYLLTRLRRHQCWNNLIVLIKSFLYMTKKSREKFNYLENEKSFQGEMKSIFPIFKGFSVAKNCLRPEIASVRILISCITTVYSRN